MSEPRIIRLRHKSTPEPSGCRWCGRIERSHGMYYTTAKGIHLWEPPTLAQRKARIIANIGKRQAADIRKQLRSLDGSNAAVISMMTGYSKEELKDLGGVPERETKEERKLRLRADRGRM